MKTRTTRNTGVTDANQDFVPEEFKNVARQSGCTVHAALLLASETSLNANASVVVLSCSDKKFEESKLNKRVVAVVRDKGLTEVVPGTETCLAFLD